MSTFPTMYSDEELLESLRSLAMDVGRTPTSTDLAEREDLPNRSTFRSRFGTWNQSLRAAGLEPVQRYSYSSDEIVDEIQTVADTLGHTPSREQFETHAKMSAAPVRNTFGSWANGLEAAGLEPADRTTDEELIEALRSFSNYYGRGRTATPTKRQMDEDGPYAASTYADRFGSWTKAVVQAGLNPDSRRISKTELLDTMENLAADIDARPTWRAMEEHGRFSGWPYLREFGSWKGALEAAGFDVPQGGRPSGSVELSTIDILAELRAVARKWGRPPTEAEFDGHAPIASTTVIRRFGSWRNALERAGLEAAHSGTSAAVADRPSPQRHDENSTLSVTVNDADHTFRPGQAIGDRRSNMLYDIIRVNDGRVVGWPVGFRSNLRRVFSRTELEDGFKTGLAEGKKYKGSRFVHVH